MATDIERLVSFEEAYYDQYDYYNLMEYSCHARGKGRTKREIELNTNRHSPAGHERKIVEKFQNSEMKRRRTKNVDLTGVCGVDRGARVSSLPSPTHRTEPVTPAAPQAVVKRLNIPH
ncbi:hypothetical protein D4764_14G0001290 [Takifugu flavidus]|uniref:Nuclear protein 1 n=1 Tax=Takifugu flavidus TaxID=433684 RepID=A0A5C6P5K7_9TELE|nr:hypothetical protein D4764_14G0001290 [Takifugu flavidus]